MKPINIIFAVIVVSLIVVVGSRLINEGKLPLQLNLPTPSQIASNERRVIVEEENTVIETVEKTSPSVVAIGVTSRTINPFSGQSLGSVQNTIGTGFVVSEKGVIVTNRHVVSDIGQDYSVATKDGKKLDITKIYRDPVLDLALLQVSGSNLKALELGDSSKLKAGQIVIAIGNALGRFSNTVTTGVVSGLGRDVTILESPFSGALETLDDLIQTDAAINPGNSGGPLLNSAGQVIGVNVATTEGAQNIGFAIPIDSIKPLIDEFLRTGSVSRGYLGIRYMIVTKDAAILNEVPQGAYIQDVLEDSPAEKVGLKPGDIITKIDGKAINTENPVANIVRNKKSGEKVNLEVWRDGKTLNLTTSLEQAPSQ
ncbi:trypsin-like peptidase domain-containing protein [Candidatus Daviesbacteria bacterium]|nr:trypsin-like peptidase domain-containing protein [Candidatus Daviesbacteria bacterium]